MYTITAWADIRRVAPQGAKYFRYRRPTGERRKWYEGGYAFPLEPEALEDRKPAHADGIFAVCFYTEEEGNKPASDARPLIIQMPDKDELFVEFPTGIVPGDGGDSLYKREQLITIKDLAKSAALPLDVMLKLVEKVSHERDLMAVQAEENRIGPVWQLILMHHVEIKDLLLGAAPVVAAIAKSAAERINGTAELGAGLAEIRKDQKRLEDSLGSSVDKLAKGLVMLRQQLAERAKAASAARRLPPRRKAVAVPVGRKAAPTRKR